MMIMMTVEEVAGELAQLRDYRYIVERYIVSLGQLTVVARPMQSSQAAQRPRFITFRTVKYMQMPTYWERAPFSLGTPDECRALLEHVDADIVEDLPHLFYAQLPKSRVYVICWEVYLSDTMPP
jgi:hypothetical protein